MDSGLDPGAISPGRTSEESCLILLLDNYDSFTHNLDHLLRSAGGQVTVIRSDQITVDAVMRRRDQGLVIGPGPGRPEDRGIALDLLAALRGRIPILGVCLGHQAMGQFLGGRTTHASSIVHGKTSLIHHDEQGIFKGVSNPTSVMRYHSLVVDPQSLPDTYEVSAWLEDKTIMAIRDRETQDEGIQFHPESFLTQDGPLMARNFLNRATS